MVGAGGARTRPEPLKRDVGRAGSGQPAGRGLARGSSAPRPAPRPPRAGGRGSRPRRGGGLRRMGRTSVKRSGKSGGMDRDELNARLERIRIVAVNAARSCWSTTTRPGWSALSASAGGCSPRWGTGRDASSTSGTATAARRRENRAGEQLRPWLNARAEPPVGPLFRNRRRPDPRTTVVGRSRPQRVPPRRLERGCPASVRAAAAAPRARARGRP
jgi:hypothetical protein